MESPPTARIPPSRLIADLYAAAGYDSRIVDMYGHAVAEVRYEGGWHYADADMFGGGEVVTMPDGHIPSVAELSRASPRSSIASRSTSRTTCSPRTRARPGRAGPR